MRKPRRTVLRVFGLLVLLAAALGGLAAAGLLPPFNRWVEGRLLAELRVLGVETDSTHLRELSWKRAVVGPVELQLPGLELRASEARAELGWAVLARRGAPHVVLSGLALDVDLARLAELRGALQPQDGGFPYGQLEIENSRMVLRNGERRLELPFSGSFDSMVEEFRAVLVVGAPELAGRITVRGDLVDDSVEIAVHEGRALPERWRELLIGVAPAEVAAARFAPDAILRLTGSAVVAEGRWRSAKIDAELPAFDWNAEPHFASAGEGRFALGLESGGAWRCELRLAHASWVSGDRSAQAESPVLVVEPGSARLTFPSGRAAMVGLELAGDGDFTARRVDPALPITAEALLHLTRAGTHGWDLAKPAEMRLRWNGAELAVAAPALELTGMHRLQLGGLEATIGGLREGHPRLVGKAQAGVALGSWLAAGETAWRLDPEIVAANVTLSAVLEAGAEGVRAELTVPAQRRMVQWAGGRAEAVLGGEAVINLDREYVSGRASLEAHDIIARRGELSLLAPDASLVLRWPRVWRRVVARWSDLPRGQVGRELLWTGDYEGRLGEAVVRDGAAWCATGVGVQFESRGTEIFETGGVALGLKIGDFTAGELRAANWSVEATGGLEGATVRSAWSLAGLPFTPTVEQTLRWSDGFEAEGTFGFDPVELAGDENLSRWWPQLAGTELSGGVAVSGRSRFAQGQWLLGANVILQDFNVRRPAQRLAIEGLRGRIDFADLLGVRTAPSQTLAYRSVSFGEITLTDGSTTFSLESPERLRVEAWSSVGFGGRLACEPFAFDPAHPEVAARVTVSGAKLEELLRLFDDVPAEASGVVEGELPVRWGAVGLSLGTGYLKLGAGELGRVHFTRDLHLLTNGRDPASPEYASLRQVEQSIQTLVFNRLRIDTYPADAAGQSARVRLVGAPANGEFSVPVNLDINVNAPLEHFLNWGQPRASKAAARP